MNEINKNLIIDLKEEESKRIELKHEINHKMKNLEENTTKIESEKKKLIRDINKLSNDKSTKTQKNLENQRLIELKSDFTLEMIDQENFLEILIKNQEEYVSRLDKYFSQGLQSKYKYKMICFKKFLKKKKGTI